MKILVSFTRINILKTNLLIFYRVPSNWAFIVFIWIGYLGMYFIRRGFSEGIDNILAEALDGAVAAIAAFLLLFTLTLLLQILSSTKKAGVLGEHVYIIEEDGLREITDTNNTLTKWGGIRHLKRTKQYLFIEVAPHLFHYIPRAAFDSKEAYMNFSNEIQKFVDTSSG